MNILTVNDDGIGAEGLYYLVRSLGKAAKVVAAAPSVEHSGASSAITARHPLIQRDYYKNGEFFGYSISGTPVDCVRIALNQLVPAKPDYLFAGINPGVNVSPNVYHSGTVSAANEGVMCGVTSVAVSLRTSDGEKPDFAPSAHIALEWLKIMEEKKLPKGILYNLNIPLLPLREIKGFAPATLSPSPSLLSYEKRVNPNGDIYYWIKEYLTPEPPEGCDMFWLNKGYVSVTPMYSDRTARDILPLIPSAPVI
ncbi:MAG: 5'/3'-nucleotidase SurE [Deferribacteraceae bacterium]|jgi:5'-nucleotidase|nr:5'/3'-nucleotidase SurE [Deferribacteraceae bacterium]